MKELSMDVVHTFLGYVHSSHPAFYVLPLVHIVVHNFGRAAANEKKRGRENPSGGNYVQISSKA